MDIGRRGFLGGMVAAVDVKDWRIIAGNSQFWHKTEAKDEQAAYETWVKAELEEAKSRNGRVIIATHIPPFAFASFSSDARRGSRLMRRPARASSSRRTSTAFPCAATGT